MPGQLKWSISPNQLLPQQFVIVNCSNKRQLLLLSPLPRQPTRSRLPCTTMWTGSHALQLVTQSHFPNTHVLFANNTAQKHVLNLLYFAEFNKRQELKIYRYTFHKHGTRREYTLDVVVVIPARDTGLYTHTHTHTHTVHLICEITTRQQQQQQQYERKMRGQFLH